LHKTKNNKIHNKVLTERVAKLQGGPKNGTKFMAP